MATNVSMQNSYTKEIQTIKVGWNWYLFLLSPIFGIPLFRRGLTNWGFVFLALNGAAILGNYQTHNSGSSTLSLLTFIVSFGLIVFMGVKGNELLARHYLSRGWHFLDPDSNTVRYAKTEWQIFDSPSPTPPSAHSLAG